MRRPHALRASLSRPWEGSVPSADASTSADLGTASTLHPRAPRADCEGAVERRRVHPRHTRARVFETTGVVRRRCGRALLVGGCATERSCTAEARTTFKVTL